MFAHQHHVARKRGKEAEECTVWGTVIDHKTTDLPTRDNSACLNLNPPSVHVYIKRVNGQPDMDHPAALGGRNSIHHIVGNCLDFLLTYQQSSSFENQGGNMKNSLTLEKGETRGSQTL